MKSLSYYLIQFYKQARTAKK